MLRMTDMRQQAPDWQQTCGAESLMNASVFQKPPLSIKKKSGLSSGIAWPSLCWHCSLLPFPLILILLPSVFNSCKPFSHTATFVRHVQLVVFLEVTAATGQHHL